MNSCFSVNRRFGNTPNSTWRFTNTWNCAGVIFTCFICAARFAACSSASCNFCTSSVFNTRLSENGLITIPASFNSGFTTILLHAGNGILSIAWLFGSSGICSFDVYTTKNCSSLLFFKKHGIGRSGACNIAGTNSFVGRSRLRTVVRRSLVRSAAYSLIASSSLSFVISIVLFSSIISQYPFLQKPAQNLRTSHYTTPPAKNECFF